jgi:methylmalonyl-CoA/ethylmalonyl-CoA epimerase
MSLGSIGQIALTVNNLEEAVAFYKDGLGLKQIPIPAPNLAFFDCAGIRLMLSLPEKEFRPGGGSVIYFKVTDIQAAVSNAKANGVSFTDEPHLIAKLPDHELWMAFCRDPSGNALGFMSEVR